MSAQPVGVYALTIPPDGLPIPALPGGIPAGLRITMAAIDPTESPIDVEVDSKPMAVLKIVRFPDDDSDDDSEDDYEDISDEDDEEDSDEEMEDVNGGPSDPKKAKISKKQALLNLAAADADSDSESQDSADEREAQAVLAKLQKAFKDKGKGKAEDGEEEEDSDDEGSEETLGEDEHVICTLLPTSIPQQPLDLSVAAGENVYFRVIGNHTVSLTGNYVLPAEPEDDDEDLEPDSDEELDELDGLEDLLGDEEDDSELDELDDLADPRITEIDEEVLEEKKPAKAIKAEKGKNKRPAEDSDEEPSLDAMISKAVKKEEAAATADAEPATNGETKKLSKAEKKRLKKLKNNEGDAADAPVAAPEVNGTKDSKKVQFAKNLEQGPTPSASATTSAAPAATAAGSVRTVQGITIDDRKIGTGPAAKKGSLLSMRYIGKLESGKVFDSNKSGKPFSFKLGKGEVIKGWEIGLEGVQNGGERRITIPATLAYGKKGAPPDIPPNATLKFDVKCLGVK